MSDKKRFLDKDFTRRQFLKLSGKSLAGVAMSSTMLSTLGVSATALAEDKVRVWAFPQGLLVVNADRCVGCQRCEINCTLTNDGCCSSYISRVKVTRNLYSSRNGNGLYTENNWTYFPDTCRQCRPPAIWVTAAASSPPKSLPPPRTASAAWIPTSASAAARARRRARGICPRSTRIRRSPPSA